jgi:hypothetical protein
MYTTFDIDCTNVALKKKKTTTNKQHDGTGLFILQDEDKAISEVQVQASAGQTEEVKSSFGNCMIF